jgi:hypothetical protein
MLADTLLILGLALLVLAAVATRISGLRSRRRLLVIGAVLLLVASAIFDRGNGFIAGFQQGFEAGSR